MINTKSFIQIKGRYDNIPRTKDNFMDELNRLADDTLYTTLTLYNLECFKFELYEVFYYFLGCYPHEIKFDIELQSYGYINIILHPDFKILLEQSIDIQ